MCENILMLIDVTQSKEGYFNGQIKYSWPPCSGQISFSNFQCKNYFCFYKIG